MDIDKKELAELLESLKHTPAKEPSNQPYKLTIFGFVLSAILPILGLAYQLVSKQEQLEAAIRETKLTVSSECKYQYNRLDSEIKYINLRLSYLHPDKK